jgi:hypothetical protein
MLYTIADMNTTKSIAKLQREISAVRQALQELEPMHPGSVSMQYQLCGRTGCRCMDPEHPHPHGPYHKLAYVHRGKPVCRFVRADCADEIKQRLATYKTFRNLMNRWIELSIQQAKIEFFNSPNKPKSKRTAASSSRKSSRKKKQT